MRKRSQASISALPQLESNNLSLNHQRSRSGTTSDSNPPTPNMMERSLFSNSPETEAYNSLSHSRGLSNSKLSYLDLGSAAFREGGDEFNSTSPTVSSVRESRNMKAGAASAALAAKNREMAKSRETNQRSLTRSGSESAVEVLSEIKSQLPGAIFPGLSSPTTKKWKKVLDKQALGDGEDDEEEEDRPVAKEVLFGTYSTSNSRPPVPPRASTMRNLTQPLDLNHSSFLDSTPSQSNRRQPPPPPPKRLPRRSTNPFLTSATDPSGPFSQGHFGVDLSAMTMEDRTGVEHLTPVLPLDSQPVVSSSNPFRQYMISTAPIDYSDFFSTSPTTASHAILNSASEKEPESQSELHWL